MIDIISHFLIFFGGSMSWTIALGQLLEKKKKTFNYMFAGFMFSVGSVQLINGITIIDKIAEYPFFAFLHLPFLALTGPTFFFCFKSVIGADYRLKLLDILHALPAVLVIFFLIPFYGLDAEKKRLIIMTPPALLNTDPDFFYYSVIVALVVVIVIGYMIYFLIECYPLMNFSLMVQKKVSPLFSIIVFVIYPIGYIFFLCIFAANFIKYPDGFYIGVVKYLTVLSFFLTLLIYAMSKRDSSYFKILRAQSDRSRYEKSKIKKLDLDFILIRIKSLMEEEKIFCDEDLSLNSFAGDLEIEPYQLSQIINEKFNKNFNAYINEFRIEEAKKILIDDKKRSIVSVSYAVGFNSPATFYEWFFKITGFSPSKFRKSPGKK